MKKFIALLIAAILVCSMMSFATSAVVPTSLTITETKTAPNINDGGKIDAAYGQKLFDIKASEHAKDSGNLYPSKMEGRDGDLLDDSKIQAAIAVMRNVGYMTYDKENLYIACEVTDIAPKASSNNSEYWKSTNLQLTMFVNEELSFPTIAYEGKNKVKVWGDERSVLDYELVEATFTEKSQTNYVYEIKIPWKAFPDVNSPDDIYYFTMGMVQSSMANGYVCSAFGEGYFLDASKTIPVTLVSASGETTNNNTSSTGNNNTNTTSSSGKNTSSAGNTNGQTSSTAPNTDKNQTASSNKDNATTSGSNNSSAVNNSQTASSTDNANTNSSVTDSTSAPTTGTEIVTSSETSNTESAAEGTEGTTTVVTEQGERDWTPIIIIAIVAVVIIAGGAVAIVLLNKKPKEEK